MFKVYSYICWPQRWGLGKCNTHNAKTLLCQTVCSRPAGISASTSKISGEYANWTRLEEPNTGNYLTDISNFNSLFLTTMPRMEHIHSRTIGSNIDTGYDWISSLCSLYRLCQLLHARPETVYSQSHYRSVLRYWLQSDLHKFLTTQMYDPFKVHIQT